MPWENDKKDQNWTIHHEREFLTHLGTGKWSRFVTMSRKQLLRNYISTITQRKEPWVSKALGFAVTLLEEEYGRQQPR